MIGGDISALAGSLRSETTTAVALATEAIAGVARVDDELQSFVLVDDEGALAAAADADRALRAGDERPLVGIPVAVKDIIHMPGLPTRCGSPAYSPEPVADEATVVARLRAAGAVIIGKTTAHELACGVYSAPAANPWGTSRVPGGSSGGSGAAVAAGIVPMALGSDTGGSIRIPASVCGVAGLKPTYGRVPRTGVEPLSWSLDHIGPLGRTVADCALALSVIAGRDPDDPSTADVPVSDYTAALDAGVAGLRVGVLSGAPFSPMEEDVAAAFDAACEVMHGLGASLVPVLVPALEHTLAAEFGIVGPEAAAYHRDLLRSRPELIDPGIRALLVAGMLLPAVQYLKALEARRVISDAIRACFASEDLDLLVTPTLPATAAERDQEEFLFAGAGEPVTLAYVRTTAPFNLSGLPALSVPCGFDRHGLPIGLQFAGRPFAEATVLRAGAAYEAATSWHLETPPIHVASEVS